ncbi:MAG: DUF3575 domain-containing protein [Chitinophagaceae bacterium]|nr:DUF3575 domain-containing protein [Chitinophagaceae bacterium]
MQKKLFYLSLLSALCTTNLYAQEKETANTKNVVKLNLFALGLKNVTLQYERAVAKKVTVAGTLRFMPKGSIPLKKTFINYADDPDVEKQINNLSVGNFAFMPEVRYYFGKRGAFHGFYLGLFANMASYSATVPLEYDNGGTKETIPMTGKLTGITGGLMIGAQFKLSNKIYLDWWILGPNYGSSSGSLSGQKVMDVDEQQDLRDELRDLDIPLTRFTYTVTGTGATMDFKGPWGGLRSGLCIGFRF